MSKKLKFFLSSIVLFGSISAHGASIIGESNKIIWNKNISFSRNGHVATLCKGDGYYLYEKIITPNVILNTENLSNYENFKTKVPVSMIGDSATGEMPTLSVTDDVELQFLGGLTLKDAVLNMKPNTCCDDETQWERPNFIVSNSLNLEGEIHFGGQEDNKILIEKTLNVSKLDRTQMHFEKHYHYIAFSGIDKNKQAVLDYYNPNDADGITDIQEIRNVDDAKKSVYVNNIRTRLEKLFVGEKVLLRGLKFYNMKIFNYNLDEYLFTPQIMNAIENINQKSSENNLKIENA